MAQVSVALPGGFAVALSSTASPTPSPTPREFTDDDVQPGPAPLLIITTLLAVSWLLVRSMRRHLRKIPADLDVPSRRSDS